MTVKLLSFGKIETTLALHGILFGQAAVDHFQNKLKRVREQMGSIDRLEGCMSMRMQQKEVLDDCKEKGIPPPVHDPCGDEVNGASTLFVMCLRIGCYVVDFMMAFPEVVCAKFGPIFLHFYPRMPFRALRQIDACTGLVSLLGNPGYSLPQLRARIGQVLPYTHCAPVRVQLQTRLAEDAAYLVSRSHVEYE